MPFFPAFGGAPYSPTSRKVIRLILKGCTNRPFFHICVQELRKEPDEPVIEQIGNYDPLPNEYNEKLVAINYQRLEYWLKQGAITTEPVAKLLGLSGYYPVHPASMEDAYRRRKELADIIEKLKTEAAEFLSEKDEGSQEVQAEAAKEQSESTESSESFEKTESTESSDSFEKSESTESPESFEKSESSKESASTETSLKSDNDLNNKDSKS